MPDNSDKINELHAKLVVSIAKKENFYWEINELKPEISRLKTNAVARPSGDKTV